MNDYAENQASWMPTCCHVLSWAVGRTELPPPHEGFNAGEMLESLGFNVPGPSVIVVKDLLEKCQRRTDAEASKMARRVLGYFQGVSDTGKAPDTAKLRNIVPANPMQGYNVRRVLDHTFDIGSVQELRPKFGGAALTAFARLEGHPVGVIASQPTFLGGAIDSPTSDKIARFTQLCDAHDIPIVILSDTPGLMVGPEVEKTGLVRHSARILVALAKATIPCLTVVMRKAYGLGYYVMGSKALDPALLVAWPTAEFGSMGLEGAARIIWKKNFEAIENEAERNAAIQEKTDYLMNQNVALEVGGRFEYDDVIDPADTRDVLVKTVRVLPKPLPRDGRKRTVDAW